MAMGDGNMGRRIVKSRAARGLSQASLASRLKVSSTAVWNWEQNGVTPRPKALAQLAKVLGVTEQYLLTGQAAFGTGKTATEILQSAARKIAAINGIDADRVVIDFRIKPSSEGKASR